MMLLVIDVTKGIQTQTAEVVSPCDQDSMHHHHHYHRRRHHHRFLILVQGLVIGQIMTDTMLIVLNKVDLLGDGPAQASQLARVEANIRKALKVTKFADAPMVPVAARPGGAKEVDL